jgi:hypothetical protein
MGKTGSLQNIGLVYCPATNTKFNRNPFIDFRDETYGRTPLPYYAFVVATYAKK